MPSSCCPGEENWQELEQRAGQRTRLLLLCLLTAGLPTHLLLVLRVQGVPQPKLGSGNGLYLDTICLSVPSNIMYVYSCRLM